MKINMMPENTLMDFLKLFGGFNANEKNVVLYIILKNHLMYEKENCINEFNKHVKYLEFMLDKLDDEGIYEDIGKEMFGKDVFNDVLQTKIDNIDDMLKLFNHIMINKKYSFLEGTYKFNFALIKNGLCPMVFYAFGNQIIQEEIDETYMRKLIEFSLMTLYRPVELKKKNVDDSNILYNTSGAISNIYIQQEEKESIVKKIPKNIASFHFLAEQEFEIYKLLSNSHMHNYIANGYKFDDKEKIVSHKFVAGVTGEDLLFKHIDFSEEQISQLKKIYDSYLRLNNKEIILDLHPGNFIWSDEEKKWTIIDLGAIPEIGSDYYRFSSFEQYFQKIWLDREKTMKMIPIRSLDFSIDLDIKDKVIKGESEAQ